MRKRIRNFLLTMALLTIVGPVTSICYHFTNYTYAQMRKESHDENTLERAAWHSYEDRSVGAMKTPSIIIPVYSIINAQKKPFVTNLNTPIMQRYSVSHLEK